MPRKPVLCIHLFPGTPNTPGAGIKVEQQGVDRFTVSYGLQVKKGLDYVRAAKELGECIFHHLACESLLDNRIRGER